MGERKRVRRDETEKRTIIATTPRTAGAPHGGHRHTRADRLGDSEATAEDTFVSPLMTLPAFPTRSTVDSPPYKSGLDQETGAPPGVWRDERLQGWWLLPNQELPDAPPGVPSLEKWIAPLREKYPPLPPEAE